MNESEVEKIEVRLLLEAVYQRYGYDFREYALSTMKRRIVRRMEEEKLPTITALQDRLLHDPPVMERLLMDFSITTSTMFRDPGFFRCLREKVIPILRTYPYLRIWHAGWTIPWCASLTSFSGPPDLIRSAPYILHSNSSEKSRAVPCIFPVQPLPCKGSPTEKSAFP